ncbi:DnaJ C-terminal domain-containing protein [Prochlorococcus sp. MIT 1223]|uniref:DnaJ C-terminal domain-containing protein n=1 Tax=Prochlorococcus sp. MIT 1223 TaxID=3096217 RepID=UPI002A763213|nr:DnaJ C-terminal domain-containing protein [Prochlorococcus sp. MIT 1223]
MASDGFKDYYKILGVERDAGEADIKRAYRALARTLHPDVNPSDSTAEVKFKEINEAYEVLSDPEKRAKYEQYGKYWNQVGGIGQDSNFTSGFNRDFGNYGNFDDFINELLGRFGGVSTNTYSSSNGFAGANTSKKPINLDAEVNLSISFLEAFHGTQRTLSVNNERFQIQIPKGVKTGLRLRVKGKGNIQPGIGRRGDLFLKVDIQPHFIWKLDGDNLRGELPVTFDEIALGTTVKIQIPDGETEINIPSGILPGQNLRLKGKGWPSKGSRGDLILTLKVKFPPNWSSNELELIHKLQKFRSFDPRKEWNESSQS